MSAPEPIKLEDIQRIVAAAEKMARGIGGTFVLDPARLATIGFTVDQVRDPSARP